MVIPPRFLTREWTALMEPNWGFNITVRTLTEHAESLMYFTRALNRAHVYMLVQPQATL